jgi:hypothetical protein
MPENSFAEYAPEPTETKKKDVVWFALNNPANGVMNGLAAWQNTTSYTDRRRARLGGILRRKGRPPERLAIAHWDGHNPGLRSEN